MPVSRPAMLTMMGIADTGVNACLAGRSTCNGGSLRLLSTCHAPPTWRCSTSPRRGSAMQFPLVICECRTPTGSHTDMINPADVPSDKLTSAMTLRRRISLTQARGAKARMMAVAVAQALEWPAVRARRARRRACAAVVDAAGGDDRLLSGAARCAADGQAAADMVTAPDRAGRRTADIIQTAPRSGEVRPLVCRAPPG